MRSLLDPPIEDVLRINVRYAQTLRVLSAGVKHNVLYPYFLPRKYGFEYIGLYSNWTPRHYSAGSCCTLACSALGWWCSLTSEEETPIPRRPHVMIDNHRIRRRLKRSKEAGAYPSGWCDGDDSRLISFTLAAISGHVVARPAVVSLLQWPDFEDSLGTGPSMVRAQPALYWYSTALLRHKYPEYAHFPPDGEKVTLLGCYTVVRTDTEWRPEAVGRWTTLYSSTDGL